MIAVARKRKVVRQADWSSYRITAIVFAVGVISNLFVLSLFISMFGGTAVDSASSLVRGDSLSNGVTVIGVPACPDEENLPPDAQMCHWNAEDQGNGEGKSFLLARAPDVAESPVVIYLNEQEEEPENLRAEVGR